MSTIRLHQVDCHVLPTRTRFPFRYGIAAMTAAPHLFLRAEFEIDGRRQVGIASEGLPPKWFTKDPDTTFEQDLPDMLAVIRHAIDAAINAGEHASLFDWWWQLYQSQRDWAASRSLPPLLAQLGASLAERAGLDALCRALRMPLAVALAEQRLGLRLDAIHPDLDPTFLPPPPLDTGVLVRHTIGLADPLTDADIPHEDRADDSLPQSLEASIAAYGLRYFKIKICGDLDQDLPRLATIRQLLEAAAPDYRFTLDGNEQYRTLAAFREHWQVYRDAAGLGDLLSPDHLLFVEQPVHRDRALDDGIAADLADWPDAPPLIIDESDSELDSAARALTLGYAGTSHKNCKGIIKSLANAALLAARRASEPERPAILSGEDLANLGPVALQQDLAAAHLLGIRHVERNGHHYFPGLKAYPASLQEAALAHHGDLYRAHPDGYPAVAIRDGRIDLSSVVTAPFGTAFRVDEVTPEFAWKPLDELTVADLTLEI